MTVQIADSVMVVSLSFLKIAMTKSKAITIERTPIVINQTVADSKYLTFFSRLVFANECGGGYRKMGVFLLITPFLIFL